MDPPKSGLENNFSMCWVVARDPRTTGHSFMYLWCRSETFHRLAITVAILAQDVCMDVVSASVAQTMAGQELWHVSAVWASGKTWTLQASPDSTVGELRRRIMLAAGGMRRTVLVLGDAVLDGDSDPLCNVQGFQNGASLTIAVSREFNEKTAREVTDAELNAFVRQFPQAPEMQDMCLKGCVQVTDAGIEALAKNCTSLTAINLEWCQQVTDAGIEALAKNCTSLTVINLAGSYNNPSQVTDAGIEALAKSCTSLTEINLGNCNQVTDAGIEALAKNCTSLTAINLEECQQVTDAGIEALAKNCTSLTGINLCSCQQVTDAGIEVLAKNCTSLTDINLCNCQQVTDAGIEALAKNCTSLTGINLYNCQQVSAGMKDRLRARGIEVRPGHRVAWMT